MLPADAVEPISRWLHALAADAEGRRDIARRTVQGAMRALAGRMDGIADADLDAAAVQTLVAEYQAHARFEEEVFLPLAQSILGRNSAHMAALGLSLHIRHASEGLLRRHGHI